MNVRSYRPGGWYGIVGARAVVALPPSEKSRVAALWELVDAGDEDFDVVLDALISGGLRELPGFALVFSGEERTSVVVRGTARAELVADGEEVSVEGTGASTWVERSFTGVERLSLVLEDDGTADAASYVVDGGLFRASRIEDGPVEEEPVAPALVLPDTEPDLERDAAPEPAPEPEPEVAPEPEPEPARSPEPPNWTPPAPVGPSGPPPAPIGPPPPPPELPTEAMQLPVEPEPEPAAELDPDHDGMTRTGAWQPPAEGPPGIPGQERAPDVTIAVARLTISNGEVIEVDRAIVIGRAPEGRRFSETEQPTLVTVPSPNLEISSTHVEIRPGSGADHGTAVVTDLGSTNGTVLVQPGLGSEELSPGVAVQLIPGALIDLGDGVTIQVSKP